MALSRLINRNVNVGRSRTSMRLEPEFWDTLNEICRREGLSVREVMRRVDETRESGTRTSAIRVFVLRYLRHAATEDGHRDAGHGPVREPLSAYLEGESPTQPGTSTGAGDQR